jgi:hypothetical protein
VPLTAPKTEGGEVCERLDQDLLRGILGVLRVVEHPHRDVVDPRLMTPRELLEGIALSGSRSGHEAAVLGIVGGDVGQGARTVHGSLSG